MAASNGPFAYQWFKNGTAPANQLNEVATQQTGTQTANLTLMTGQPGDYYVKVTDSSGQTITYGPFRVTVLATCPTGREAAQASEPSTGLRISLLGNPVVGEQLRAMMTGAQDHPLSVELINLQGHSVRQQHWEQAGEIQTLEWNLSGQPGGVYLLQAMTPAQDGIPAQWVRLKVVKP